MSAITEAMRVFGLLATQTESKLQSLVDQKEKEIAEQKDNNKLLDLVEDARRDGNITDEEVSDIVSEAASRGLQLSVEEDFAVITKAHAGEDNAENAVGSKNAWVDRPDQDFDDPRNKELDAVTKKMQRHIDSLQDETGLTDVELNLQMTKYSDHLARMNNAVGTIGEISQATRQRG